MSEKNNVLNKESNSIWQVKSMHLQTAFESPKSCGCMDFCRQSVPCSRCWWLGSMLPIGDGSAGVEFHRELRESIWILLDLVCENLWTLLHSVSMKLLTVYESLTGFSQINLARVFVKEDSRTYIKILALFVISLWDDGTSWELIATNNLRHFTGLYVNTPHEWSSKL